MAARSATRAIGRRRRSIAVRRFGHRAKHMTLPLAIVGGFVPMGADLLSAFKVGGIEAALGHVSLCTTGYDPADGIWKPMFAVKKLYGPLLLGALVHKAANRLGINRMLSSMGIPLIRV
jgi:hypothetical protein